MQKYRSHKIVEAADLGSKNIQVLLNGNGSISVTIAHGDKAEYLEIPASRVASKTIDEIEDGYVVRYDDGFVSWSPRKPFEDGYAAIPPDAHAGGDGKAQ